MYTVSQNVSTLYCCNFDVHESILVSLAEMLLRKYAIKRSFIFLPHLTCASALPLETGNPEIIFSLNCCMLFLSKTHKTR